MTKISQYSTDVNITGNDKWIGSDAQNYLITKNFTPNNLANYFNGNNVIDIGTSIRYMYQTLDPGEAREQGTISFETEIGPQVNFSDITTFLIAKNTLKGNTVSQYLDFLVDGKVILSKASNINVFGYYKITSLEPWIPNTNFFVVTVDFLAGNGFIYEDLDYLVSLVDKAQDVITPTLQSVVNAGNGISNFGGIGVASIQSTNFTNNRTLYLNDNSYPTIRLVDNGNSSHNLTIDLDTINLNGTSYNWSSIVSGVPQNLQQVTDIGSITTNTITVGSLSGLFSQILSSAIGTENYTTGTYAYLDSSGYLGLNNGTVESYLKNTNVTNAGVVLEFPNKPMGSYTIATTADISTPTLQQVLDNNHDLTNGNNFQGTGAGVFNTGNQVIGFGTSTLSSNSGVSVNAFGVQALQANTANHVNGFGQEVGASNTYKNVNLFGYRAYADANNQTVFSKWISGFTTYLGRLSFNNITDARKWELPDASGTIALTSNIGNWGALNYPTWTTGTPFVKMTAAGTFALDTNTYLTSAVTAVTATSPITSSGGNTPVISTSMATNKLIGRSTAGTGVMEEITVGTGLSLSGGTLNATAQTVGFEQNFLLMGA